MVPPVIQFLMDMCVNASPDIKVVIVKQVLYEKFETLLLLFVVNVYCLFDYCKIHVAMHSFCTVKEMNT